MLVRWSRFISPLCSARKGLKCPSEGENKKRCLEGFEPSTSGVGIGPLSGAVRRRLPVGHDICEMGFNIDTYSVLQQETETVPHAVRTPESGYADTAEEI
jgi:hypothetical protein